MNREQYNSDPRYAKVLEQMDLLGIMDVTTTRQYKNGTIVWKLPIKNEWGGKLIEVASFKTGYVRNQNSGYSNYQLNKRDYTDEYFPAYEWKTVHGEYQQVKIPGQYRKWRRKTCKLIPIEIDRLEYLISYCLKNYYIKNANQVADGKFVPKWKLENAQNGMVPKWKYDEAMDLGKTNAEAEALNETLNNEFYLDKAYERIKELESEVRGLETKYQASQSELEKQNEHACNELTDFLNEKDKKIKELEDKLKKANKENEWQNKQDVATRVRELDLQNKLDTIKRIADYE